MRLALHTVPPALACLAIFALGTAPAAAGCDGLAGKTFGDASIVSAGSVSPPFSISASLSVSVPFCRVQGTIKPTTDSLINFELWLPPESVWNGKYEGVGNGGFAGSIAYGPMNRALGFGYAVSGTDTGHVGSGIDASWAPRHPEKVADFGWRAIHLTAMASKSIVQAYYNRPPAHAYFTGCSDGGREALMEAQRFPQDYDGIIAVAPANYWTQGQLGFIWDELALTAEPGGALTAAKLPAITAAALAACHGQDGFIEDPGQCHFDPAVLQCEGAETDTCLTTPQIATVKKIYSGRQDAAGKSLFPGFGPGGEADPGGWAPWILGTGATPGEGSLQLAYGGGFLANMVFEQPDWDFHRINFETDVPLTTAKTAHALDSTDPNLEPFRSAGGKLLQVHGWSDAALPPAASIQYYEAVAAKSGGVPQTQSFYRLFMAPGMEHCSGGPGPNAFGGPFGLAGPTHDAAHDAVQALARWVEDGVAPAQIVATKYQDDDPRKGIAMQRPWCPYPAVAHYAGQGSRKDAASFACVTPGTN